MLTCGYPPPPSIAQLRLNRTLFRSECRALLIHVVQNSMPRSTQVASSSTPEKCLGGQIVPTLPTLAALGNNYIRKQSECWMMIPLIVVLFGVNNLLIGICLVLALKKK